MLKIFQSTELDEKIYQEMFDGLGTSGSKEARQIAETIKKVQKRLIFTLEILMFQIVSDGNIVFYFLIIMKKEIEKKTKN